MKFTSVCAVKFIWNVAESTAIQNIEFICCSIAHFHHVFCVICFYGFSLINLWVGGFLLFFLAIFLVVVSLFVDIFVYAFSAYLRFITSVQLDRTKMNWICIACTCRLIGTNWRLDISKCANPLFRRLKYAFSRHFSHKFAYTIWRCESS